MSHGFRFMLVRNQTVNWAEMNLQRKYEDDDDEERRSSNAV